MHEVAVVQARDELARQSASAAASAGHRADDGFDGIGAATRCDHGADRSRCIVREAAQQSRAPRRPSPSRSWRRRGVALAAVRPRASRRRAACAKPSRRSHRRLRLVAPTSTPHRGCRRTPRPRPPVRRRRRPDGRASPSLAVRRRATRRRDPGAHRSDAPASPPSFGAPPVAASAPRASRRKARVVAPPGPPFQNIDATRPVPWRVSSRKPRAKSSAVGIGCRASVHATDSASAVSSVAWTGSLG